LQTRAHAERSTHGLISRANETQLSTHVDALVVRAGVRAREAIDQGEQCGRMMGTTSNEWKREEKAKAKAKKVDQRRGRVRRFGGLRIEEMGRTHPCRSRPSRKRRSKAAQHLRRSRALPRARSPSLHRERVPRLVREGDRAHTHLCIRLHRTFV